MKRIVSVMGNFFLWLVAYSDYLNLKSSFVGVDILLAAGSWVGSNRAVYISMFDYPSGNAKPVSARGLIRQQLFMRRIGSANPPSEAFPSHINIHNGTQSTN